MYSKQTPLIHTNTTWGCSLSDLTIKVRSRYSRFHNTHYSSTLWDYFLDKDRKDNRYHKRNVQLYFLLNVGYCRPTQCAPCHRSSSFLKGMTPKQADNDESCSLHIISLQGIKTKFVFTVVKLWQFMITLFEGSSHFLQGHLSIPTKQNWGFLSRRSRTIKPNNNVHPLEDGPIHKRTI